MSSWDEQQHNGEVGDVGTETPLSKSVNQAELSPTAMKEDGGHDWTSKDHGEPLDGVHVVPEGLLKEDLKEDINDRAVAQKLMRTASWINTFFLLTCDVLGVSADLAEVKFSKLPMLTPLCMFVTDLVFHSPSSQVKLRIALALWAMW